MEVKIEFSVSRPRVSSCRDRQKSNQSRDTSNQRTSEKKLRVRMGDRRCLGLEYTEASDKRIRRVRIRLPTNRKDWRTFLIANVAPRYPTPWRRKEAAVATRSSFVSRIVGKVGKVSTVLCTVSNCSCQAVQATPKPASKLLADSAHQDVSELVKSAKKSNPRSSFRLKTSQVSPCGCTGHAPAPFVSHHCRIHA